VRAEWDHLARKVMYDAARELFGPSSWTLDVVEVSGRAFENLLMWRSYTALENIDVCDVDDYETFPLADLIVLDQVLEHVRAPLDALFMLRSALKPGGRLFVATPFLIRIHPSPVDLWRWTPAGLVQLMNWAGFKNVDASAWGNRAAVVENFDGWATVAPGSDMTNEPHFPVTVWAVGTR
jgi:SAM-dependent methyltransferase